MLIVGSVFSLRYLLALVCMFLFRFRKAALHMIIFASSKIINIHIPLATNSAKRVVSSAIGDLKNPYRIAKH